MTWQETHDRWQALLDAVAVIEASGGTELPWNDRYARVFGDRAGLLAMLRYRWLLITQAQLEPGLTAPELATARRELAARNAPLLRVLAADPADQDVHEGSPPWPHRPAQPVPSRPTRPPIPRQVAFGSPGGRC